MNDLRVAETDFHSESGKSNFPSEIFANNLIVLLSLNGGVPEILFVKKEK